MPGKGHRHDLSGCPVIVTENVEDYRACIPMHVTSDDVVIELGCAQGVTTSIIAQHAKEVIGIDKSGYQAVHAQARHPNLTILQMDAYDLSAVIKLGRRFTKIFIDVSGNRPVGDLVTLIEKYEKVFDPELFVVKCFPLVKLVNRASVYRVAKGGEADGGEEAGAGETDGDQCRTNGDGGRTAQRDSGRREEQRSGRRRGCTIS